jgi:mRNA-degrading endonuclease RelE of RelBE toxin-antitoxin system
VPRLGVTARCEDDLDGLPPAEAERLLDKFEELRAQAPESGDLVDGLQQRECHSLHSGRYRAVTWYDRQADIVWLLAAAIHRSGTRDDTYALAIEHEHAGRLYPTDRDYRALAEAERRDRIVSEARELRRLREETIVAPELGRRRFDSEHGLQAEIWAEEVIPELAVARLRLRMTRTGGERIGEAELAILLAGPFDTSDPIPVPDPDGDDLHHRCFEGYFTRLGG